MSIFAGKLVDDLIEEFFTTIAKNNLLKTGDISPEQAEEIEAIKQRLGAIGYQYFLNNK